MPTCMRDDLEVDREIAAALAEMIDDPRRVFVTQVLAAAKYL
jgi:hypothetical protein